MPRAPDSSPEAGRAKVIIDYRRLPDRTQRFEQYLVHRTPRYTVTYLPAARLERPVRAGRKIVLEPAAPVVWFTYPGEWFDIGRFHLVDGAFTGLYANVLTPVEMEGLRWRTTDLCLDVWSGAGGELELLDEDEFTRALDAGWLDPATAARARAVADDLLLRARAGAWPPPEVEEWTLERVREALAYSSDSSR